MIRSSINFVRNLFSVIKKSIALSGCLTVIILFFFIGGLSGFIDLIGGWRTVFWFWIILFFISCVVVINNTHLEAANLRRQKYLQQLEAHLHNHLPLIGWLLQVEAVKTLLKDGSSDAIRILTNTIHSKNPKVLKIISNILSRLENKECIDAICAVWVEKRYSYLTNLIVKKGWVASAPVEVRVVTALKIGKLQVVTDGGKEIIEPLLKAFQDRDIEIASRASKCTILFEQLEYQEFLCSLVIEQDHPIAHQITIEAQYAPREPSQRALFYFLTEQWEKYDSLDFEHNLLQKAHQNGNKPLRQRIAKKVKQTGRVELIKVLAGGQQKKQLGEMTDAEWETTLAILDSSKQWENMWQLAQKAPAIWSKELLQKLKQVTWLPTFEQEKSSFETLAQLAKKCLEKIPPIGRLVRCQMTLIGHTDSIYNVIFSPDGKLLVSWSHDKTIRLWQLPDGKPVATLIGHTGNIYDVIFSPDGKLLVSGSGDKTIRLWQLPEGKHLATLAGHTDSVRGFTFSPDGRLLVSWSRDTKINLWQLPDGRHLATLTKHSDKDWDWFEDVIFSPDGKLLVSWSHDKTIRLWQLPDGKLIKTLRGHKFGVNNVIFSPDGRMLISWGRDTIKLWLMPDGKHFSTLTGHTDYITNVIYSPDRRLLVSWNNLSLDNTIRLWQLSNGKHLATLTGHSHNIQGVAFSPNGKLLVSWSDETIRLWEMPDGKHLATLIGHIGRVTGVTFSFDGQLLVSWSNSSRDKTIRLWQLPEGKHLATLTGHIGEIKNVVFSPNGRLLVSWSEDETIHLSAMPDGKHITTLTEHTDSVWKVIFDSDGQLLISVSSDRTIRLWKSDLLSLSRLPIGQLSEQDREFIQESLQNKKITQEERHWLEFIQELSNWHRRFDVELEDAPQLINAGEFDIEIDG